MSGVGFAQDLRTESRSHYSPGPLEARWQDVWRETGAFSAPPPAHEGEPAYLLADCAVDSEDALLGSLRSFTIADACARFLRAKGRAVLFSVCMDSFGAPAELEASRTSVPPHEWVRRRGAQIRGQLQMLGCSCAWERAFTSSDPEIFTGTQRLFLTMLERDLIYERDKQWFLRIGRYVEESERSLDTLAGWDAAVIDAQRTMLGRIDGVEMRASTFDGSELTVFTPHSDAIGKATFIAVSPYHPAVAQWARDPELAQQLAAMHELSARAQELETEQPAIVVTAVLATVPGAAGMLPVVVSPLVDARFGATAVLGIPELDATDRAIAQRLPKPAGTAWKTSGSKSAVRPAVRYRVDDLPISRSCAWGAPVPVVHCATCGTVPLRPDELPLRLPDDLSIPGNEPNPLADRPDFRDCACPTCGGAARRETDMIDPRMDEMWMWMAICLPAERRTSSMLSDPELARWLPAEQVVSSAQGATGVFERRVLARILQDLGELAPLTDREPFSRVLTQAGVRSRETSDGAHPAGGLDAGELIARVGADTVRLAMLYAAAPTRAFAWEHQPLLQCRRFLDDFYGYAEPRLREWADAHAGEPAAIDASERLRKRLAHWCTVGCDRVTLALEALELQRAAHNAMLLSTRIRDFESRAVQQRGELESLDRQAVVVAVLLLTRLLAPLTPHIAEELWSIAGNTAPVSDAGWPRLSRPARATMTS